MNQTEYFTKAEGDLSLQAGQLAEQMGIPYDSYKDLKSGRRNLRKIHRRVVDLLRVVHMPSKTPNGRARAAAERSQFRAIIWGNNEKAEKAAARAAEKSST